MVEVVHQAAGEETSQIPEETSRIPEENEDQLGDSGDSAPCTRPLDEEQEQQVSDEDDEEESQAADKEADVQAHSQTLLAESDLSADLGDAMLAALGKRVCPGHKLCPRQTSVFARLHKDASMRKEKTMQQQLDAQKERILREISEVRIIRGSTEELGGACDRLYSEADDRRARLARKQQEHQVAEDVQFGRLGQRSRSTPSLASESISGDCHWDRMHAQAQEKEQKLERIRQQKAVQEIEYLQYHSIHRISEGDEPVAFDRLYHDSQQRAQRKEQKRRQHLQAEADSVQPRKPMPKRHSVEEATQRMYNEAQLRQRRLEEKRRRSWSGKADGEPRTRSAGAVSRRLDALYQDAARRRTCREIEREQIEKEEIDMLARTSVHNVARARIAKEREAENLERVFERVHHPTIREVMHDAAGRHGGLQRRKSLPQFEVTRQEVEPEVDHPPLQGDDRPLQRWRSPPAVSEVRWRKPPPQTAKQDMRPPMSARGPLMELNAGRNNARQPRPASARRTRAD
mmetsp:Transcript_97069/g.182577  ORF Transcript_97069/g.182577 Transcript_97069/m.182577 type:complete len:516 (-) Transcript_97069:213-1760(-)